jgi:hypothetical protein
MRARTDHTTVQKTHRHPIHPFVRCVATTSPHAGYASCIAPVVAVIAEGNTFEIEDFDTLKNRRFFTH